MDAADQRTVDARLLALDGTDQKSHLGGNALLAVSLAACRAAAVGFGRPLHRHIATLAGSEPVIPMPMVNMISGGLHAGRQLDIQDVLAVPLGGRDFREALEIVSAIHARLGDRVRAEGHPTLVADEGGWAPPLSSNEAAIEWVAEAIDAERADAAIALDVAATHLYDEASGTYVLANEGRRLDGAAMTDLVAGWTADYPIVSVEDPLAEDDWPAWRDLTARIEHVQVVGDDLFTTNAPRLQRGIATGVANAVLVKPNQAGTLTEALDVIAIARDAGYRTVVSARSGETEDTFLADLAVGAGAGQIKVGSVTRSERLAKWNQLLRLEEELGPTAFAGRAALVRAP
jgi:enolase